MANNDSISEPAAPRLSQAQNKEGAEEKQGVIEREDVPEVKESAEVKQEVVQTTRSRGFLHWLAHLGPVKLLVKAFHGLCALFRFSASVQNVGMADHCTVSPGRRPRTVRKRLGRFTRFLLCVLPYRLQNALGYPVPSSMGATEVPDDVRESPTKPSGKGNKRKQDETDESEEEEQLVEFLNAELPEDEEEDDPSYEPSSRSNLDSEELQSKNDTESDIEVEEKDGIIRLKENPVIEGETTEHHKI